MKKLLIPLAVVGGLSTGCYPDESFDEKESLSVQASVYDNQKEVLIDTLIQVYFPSFLVHDFQKGDTIYFAEHQDYDTGEMYYKYIAGYKKAWGIEKTDGQGVIERSKWDELTTFE